MTSNSLKLTKFIISQVRRTFLEGCTIFNELHPLKRNGKYSKQAQNKMLWEIYFVAIIRSTHLIILLLPHIAQTEELS